LRPDPSAAEYSRPLDELRAQAKQRGRQLRRRRRALGIGGPAAALVTIIGLVVVLSSGAAHHAEQVTTDRGKRGGNQGHVPSVVITGPEAASPGGLPAGATALGGPAGGPSSPRLARGTNGVGGSAAGSAVPAVSPFQRLVFARSGANSGSLDSADIEVANADGSGLHSVTGHSAFQNLQPAWSPDGRQIAFSSDRDNTDRATHTHFEVYVMNADGSGVRRMTFSNTQGNGASSPHWSPDGRRILFADDLPSGNSALYVMDSDGSHLALLTSGADVAAGVQEVFPAWAPDGTRIALIRHPSTGSSEMVVRNLDGSHPVVVGEAFGQPTWSPDGRRLAVHVEDAATKTSRIEVLGADGSGATTVASVNEPAVATNAAWSHDGSAIAYTFDPDGFLSIDPDPTSTHVTGGGQPSSIHLIAPDGSHDRTFVAPPPGSNDDGADFAWP